VFEKAADPENTRDGVALGVGGAGHRKVLIAMFVAVAVCVLNTLLFESVTPAAAGRGREKMHSLTWIEGDSPGIESELAPRSYAVLFRNAEACIVREPAIALTTTSSTTFEENTQ
jgi:hypothetical protein